MWKRLRRGLKRTLILVLGLSLFLGLGSYWLLESDWFAAYLARELAEKLEELSGENVVVGSLELDILERRVRVDGVLVTHRAPGSDRDGDLILSIQSVSLRNDWIDGKLVLETVRIEQPFVRLHLDEDGLREFRGRSPSRSTDEFPWEELWVSGATLEVWQDENLLRLEGLSISPGEQAETQDMVADALEVRRGDFLERSAPLEVNGFSLEPGGLAADLILDFPSLSLEGGLSLDFGRDLKADFHGSSELDHLKVLVPELDPLSGRLDWDLVLNGNIHNLDIGGAVRSDSLTLASATSGEPYRVGSVDSNFWLDSGELVMEAEGLTWAGAQWDLDAQYGLSRGRYDLNLRTSEVDIVTLFSDSKLPVQSRVSGKTELEISTSGHTGDTEWAVDWTATTPLLEVYTGSPEVKGRSHIIDVPDLSAEGRIELTDGQLEVSFHAMEAPLGHLTGHMVLGLGERSDLDLELAMSRLDLAKLDPLMGLDLAGSGRADGRIYGDWKQGLKFDGRLDLADFVIEGAALADTIGGRLRSRDLRQWSLLEVDAKKGGARYGGQLSVDFGRSAWLDLQILLHQGRISDLVGVVTELPGVEGDISGNMTLEGPWNGLTGQIWMELGTVDLLGEVFEQGRLVAWMDAGQFTLEGLEIWRAEGTESLMARGSVGHGWNMHMEVLGSGFRLEYLDHLLGRDLRLRGRMSMDAQIEGTLMNPLPSGRIAVWDTWYQGWPVGDTILHFGPDPKAIKVQQPRGIPVQFKKNQLSFRGGIGKDGLDVRGAFPLASRGGWWMELDLDEFPIQRLFPEAADGRRVKGQVDGSLRAWGRLEKPELTTVEARVNDIEIVWAGHRLTNPSAWRYQQSDGHFKTGTIEMNGGRTALSLEAEGEIGGETSLEGGGQLDLELLRSLLEELDHAEGDASVGIQGQGDWPFLDLKLDLDLSNGRFDGVWFPAPVEGVSGLLEASASGYEMSQVQGRMGGGSFSVDGRMDGENWVPHRYDIHGEVVGARVQMVDFLPPFTGHASLDFDGPVDQLLMSGDIEILDMRFDERISWEDWVIAIQDERLEDSSSEAWGDYFSLEIGVTADQTLRIRNNLADLTASGELRIIGDTSRIGTVGDIRAVPGGRVYLNERDFEIIRAELHFIDPYTYDPEVDLSLVTDVNTRDERYQIDYRIVGPYSDWRTETTSDPALPQADVNALLLFGMTRAELERYGGLGGAIAAEGGDLLATALVGAGIYQLDFVPDEFRPDRIDFVSSMGSRGLATISSELRFLAEWDLGWDTTAILEQNLARGTDTYLGLEKRLARKLYARTYWAGEEYGRNVRVPGAVGLDFNVRWELD